MNDLDRARPVWMIGLDGADWVLIERLSAQGKLPNLSRMLDLGCRGMLDTPADRYAGGVWPDFYTGTPVSHHGIYHNKLWRQQRMRLEVPTDEWLTARPFYEGLASSGLGVCAVDVPMVLGKPRPLHGTCLAGWATHDLISRGSWPRPLWGELCRRFGEPKMPTESFGPQTVRSLRKLRAELLEATTQARDIASMLLERDRPDFACVVLGAPHRAGHYLWDAEASLTEIYAACDAALGRLIERAPRDATLVAFALHGMTAHHGWSDLGTRLVESLLSAAFGRRPRRGMLHRLRRKIPFHLVRPLLRRLPQRASGELVRLWSARMYDWKTTPCFPLPMDQAGYVRINLAGRERDGIVEGEPAYEGLCRLLESLFEGLRDASTGERLVAGTERAWQNAPDDDPARDLLPDLVVVWGDLKAGETRALTCDALPGFSFRVPARNASGRSGNHAARAWFVARGPGIAPGEVHGHSIRDLAPTVFALLGRDVPGRFTGTPIPLTNEAARAR